MAPPNTETTSVQDSQLAQELEQKLDLKQLAREKGRYLVYPDTKVCFHIAYYVTDDIGFTDRMLHCLVS